MEKTIMKEERKYVAPEIEEYRMDLKDSIMSGTGDPWEDDNF